MENRDFHAYNNYLLNKTDYLKRARGLDKQNYNFDTINSVLDNLADNQDMRNIINYVANKGLDADIITIYQNHSRENINYLESANMLEKPSDRDIKLTWLSRLYLERIPTYTKTLSDTD